jgi:hypothetical protein
MCHAVLTLFPPPTHLTETTMGVATTAQSSSRPPSIPRLHFPIEQVLPCILLTPLHAYYYALQHDTALPRSPHCWLVYWKMPWSSMSS